ncbi:HAMP domain-containing sensor histidine kinase [Nocardioides sp.]|uniref:sensor histidine kinase n=1 Tax=Nocardioides sp. TaxID=35761 RepID=UPI00260BB79C|nr:HAMP domain-containing sensor histidine kinase [Nocardioides sp.]
MARGVDDSTADRSGGDAVGDPQDSRHQARQLRFLADMRGTDGFRNRLIGTVAHELRNPLTSILGHLDLLREGEMSQAETARVIDLVMRSAERMEGVVDDLLVLARAGELLSLGNRDRVVLADVIEECRQLLTPIATEADVEVRFDQSASPITVRGDQGQLLRMVQNLISNAIKYSPTGSVVDVELHSGESLAEIVVRDEGVGISEADQEQLFTEFFRSHDPAVQARPGTGLGLSIVERIAHAHGGAVGIQSKLGRGTTVTVSLPLLT